MKGRSRSSSIRVKRSSGRQKAGGAARSRPGPPGPPGKQWTSAAILLELQDLANPAVREKMAYFGVHVETAHGISAPVLHAMARRIGKNHRLAEELWESGVHEARILAALIGEAKNATAAQMDRWARDFNAWDVVDSTCRYLYAFSDHAWSKADAWSRREEEYVKRAAFSLVAYLSYIDKQASDARFERFLRVIERESDDERNFVRKAVNWALRNIGKRNLRLNRAAIRAAEQIRQRSSRAARWIAADALRELTSEVVQRRLRRRRG